MVERQIDKKLVPFQVGLTGKLITSTDPSRLILESDGTTQIDNFKSLKNIRYTDNGIRGITGMTKINTTALTSHPKIQAIHQFTKSQPAENHVLVQAFNSGETESKIFRNDTAIPNQGDFNGTALHTDASGAGKGRFTNAQLGRMIYCNGVETMVYGGDESRLSNFTVFNPDGSFRYDFTEKVQNTLSDSSNVASLFQTDSGIDSNTLVLFHFDDVEPFESSDTGGTHSGLAVGGATRSDAQSQFGGFSAKLDGTGDWITVADHAELDLSGGTWTIEMWVYPTSLATDVGLYSQGTLGVDTGYMTINIDTNGAVLFSVFVGGSEVIDTAGLQTADGVVVINTWTHIAVVSSPGASNTDYRIFINGVQKAFVNDAQKPANYDSLATIGARNRGIVANTDLPFTGHIDEFRLSDSARWTSDFDVETVAYGTSATVNIRVGNILPIEGFTFTVSTANATASTMRVFYWGGSGWVAVSNLTDNTESPSGTSLGQTGTVTFDTTATLVKQKIIDKVLGFWFLIQLPSADTTTRISNVTVTESFQKLQDFWDGELRIINSAQLFEDSKNKDNTVNVLLDDFIFDDSTAAGDLSTYMIMSQLATGSEYLTLGFFERQQGLQCKLIPNKTNTTAGTVIEVEYWNGTAWVTVGAIDDGTAENDVSFTKSGFITWNPIAENTEFRREINKEDPLFYYKLSWSKSFTDNTFCYYIAGIPVQRQIDNYSFALNAQGRTFLFSNQADKKNSGIVSKVKTLNAFNGIDTTTFEFGDETEINAGAEIFVKLTTGAESDILITKTDSTFLLTGTSPENWVITEINADTGCTAPYTLKASPIGLEFSPLQSKQVAIWQSQNGIVMYDSNSIFPISDSISNFFDQTKSEAINLDKIADSYAFWDNSNGSYEYHWLFASGTSTTLDKELVFDLRRQRWWEADRSSGLRLQCGADVRDTSGAHYNYATEDVGFIHRLENGQDFSGTAIPYEMEFGDVPISGDINIESIIRHLQVVMVQKTSGTVTITHFGDGEDTGTTFTISQIKANYRFTMPMESLGQIKFGSHVFHRLKFTISTSDQTIGFEPLYIGGFIETKRRKLKD